MVSDPAHLGDMSRSRLFDPLDIAPLVFFRIVGGALITLEIAGEALTDYAQAYAASQVHFSYPLLPWLRPWPAAGVYAHFGFNVLMGGCVTLGLFYRLAAPLLFLGSTSLFLMESSVYINHTYLYCLVSLLLCFIPADRAVSLDVGRRPERAAGSAPAWCLYVLRFQLAVVYVYAGIAKLNADWIAGLAMKAALAPKAGYPLIGPLLAAPWYAAYLSIGGLLFDLLLVPALLWRRSRPLAFAAAIFFHLSNVAVFGLGTFPWFSLAVTALFFEPASFRRLPFLAHRLPPVDTDAGVAPMRNRQRAVEILLAAYAAIQIAMPLRPLLYGGNSDWTEDGHLFSWHMMLRGKTGTTAFIVRDPASGRTWREHPIRYLTDLQYRKMIGKPDLILQFAHFLARDYRRRGYPGVEVRARVMVSLNGRPLEPFVDPKVDLAAEPRSLRSYRWVREFRP